MKVVDANLLLYAINEDAPLHPRAKAWLEQTLSGHEPVALDWTVLLAVLRLSTRASIFPKPLTPPEAFDLIESWLAQPCVVVPAPAPDHAQRMRALLAPLGTAGNLTADAHLAAIALEQGAELCSCDGDFARFPNLRYTNPIA